MFSRIKNKIFNYLFIRYENYKQAELFNANQACFSKFKSIGKSFNIGKDFTIINPQYIEIGDNFFAMDRFRIEALDEYENQKFTPSIKIGNNVTFNSDIHIGCINTIEIGDNCLFASRIYITDHQHGDTSEGMIDIIPTKRKLTTKGSLIIEKNVWIGEGVIILPGVVIGENSIVGSNSVVTKNIPKNSVVVGIPAKVIKQLV